MKRDTTSYLFADGHWLQETLAKMEKLWLKEKVSVDYSDFSRLADKCFYYDAFPPDNHPSFADKEAFFESVGSISGWHVNPGISRRTGKGLRQKGVDVKLAVDAINHRVRGNMDKVILLAGDLDFLPLVTALVELGAWVELWCDPVYTPKELRLAADHVEFISLRRVGHSSLYFSIESKQPPQPNWQPTQGFTSEAPRLHAKGKTVEYRIYGDETRGHAVRQDTFTDRVEYAEWHHPSAIEQGYYLKSMESHLPWIHQET